MTVRDQPALEIMAKLFRGFADPSRLALLTALRAGEKSVSELVAATGLSQPNVSKHLACLRDCGLVASRTAGNRVYYTFADPGPAEILAVAEGMLARVGERVYACTRYEGSLHADPASGEGAAR